MRLPAASGRADYVYLLANRKNGTLYAGVTNDLIRRVYEHREGLADGFSKRYGVKTLVWFESMDSVVTAIEREKQLKNWKRSWKIALSRRRTPVGGTCTRRSSGKPPLHVIAGLTRNPSPARRTGALECREMDAGSSPA